ncbi:MAG: zinc metallopeptidase [Gammaproteobacteria bacterium]|nr:MAG: zinc metallopeptidase [Gammaproteobacteria bacterium]
MHIIIPLLLIFIVLFGPQYWASSILKRYQKPRDDFPGTGGEFARHLLKQLQIDHAGVEETDMGDHYDPKEKMVRLSQQNYSGKSLTAVVTAAHEVGHALQDHLNYRPLLLRTQMAQVAFHAERAGVLLIYAVPIIAGITRAPSSGAIMLILGILVMAISSFVHFVTLPVEFNASFNRALPVLKAGGYLEKEDMKAARKILLACALTYVAASMAGLLNIWRWITIFRR